MFEALGDRETQDLIREEEGKHCGLLIKNPEACRGCPKNPYEMGQNKNEGPAVSPVKGWRQLAEEAEELHDLFKLGLLTDFTPEEFAMIRTAHHYNENRKIEIEGNYIAGKISEILGKMFSK